MPWPDRIRARPTPGPSLDSSMAPAIGKAFLECRGVKKRTMASFWHAHKALRIKPAPARVKSSIITRDRAIPSMTHPGRLLGRELTARGLSANRLTLDVGVPSGRITDILNVGARPPSTRRCALAAFRQQPAVLARLAEPVRHCRGRGRARRGDRAARETGRRPAAAAALRARQLTRSAADMARRVEAILVIALRRQPRGPHGPPEQKVNGEMVNTPLPPVAGSLEFLPILCYVASRVSRRSGGRQWGTFGSTPENRTNPRDRSFSMP